MFPMPDFKYADPEMSLKYSRAKDYPAVAKAVIWEMHCQVVDPVIDGSGVALRGLLLRHRFLPGGITGIREVVRFIVEESRKTPTSISWTSTIPVTRHSIIRLSTEGSYGKSSRKQSCSHAKPA
jgi:uncharacterized Fe-S radical SAM superfamily protein PflX